MPAAASISDGPPPVTIGAATRLSTKILLPVPINRLMVLLPVFAVNRYFPSLVIQHGAVWPAAISSVNAPLRNNPSWLLCASVITALPSGYTEKPKGVRLPAGAETAVGAAPVTFPSLSGMTSTVPGAGGSLRVTSACPSSTKPTCAVLPAAGAPPPETTSSVVPSIEPTLSPRSTNESTVVAPATYIWSPLKSTLTGALVVVTSLSNLRPFPSRLNRATLPDPLLTAAISCPPRSEEHT